MNGRQTMLKRAEEYLKARRALGYVLRIEGAQLLRFAAWADRERRRRLTVSLALDWARASKKSSRVGQARRLEVIRPFARWLQALDPNTEVPPEKLLGPAHPRRQPYLLSETQIGQLLAPTDLLGPPGGIRSATFRTLFGLLVCSGLRPGEAVRLTREDANLDSGILRIRDTKFHKSRLVPLHHTATIALRRYASLRDQLVPDPTSDAFFLLGEDLPVTVRKADWAFKRVRGRLGWRPAAGGRPPRLYDLRHGFACTQLMRWHAKNRNVNVLLPALSTYLGHVKVTDTYWYMTGTPGLMAVCAARFERFAGTSNGGGR
jgi:integrase